MPYNTGPPPLVHHATSVSATDILGSAHEFLKDKLYYTSVLGNPGQYPNVNFFSIDRVLVYINFYSDFGPSNLAHVIRFCDIMQDKLKNPRTADKKICLYSSMDPDKRANAAFLMCAYMLIVHKQTPEEAFRPLCTAKPFLSYRDAGYGTATYYITIPDCLRGLHKGLTLGLLDIDSVDVEEYEFYEKVENGDFNWLTDKFLALASPKDDPVTTRGAAMPAATHTSSALSLLPAPLAAVLGVTSSQELHQQPAHQTALRAAPSGWGFLSRATASVAPAPAASAISPPAKGFQPAYRMQDLVKYLKQHNVGTVVRLNNRTYDRTQIVKAGIDHVEMYFPDGTNPPDGILMRFLELCESRPGPIAVHCKAGLGRTGSLIAAYLMKHYKFTAAEVISFLRILRPGCVVGPQQNYLQNMQDRLHRLHPSGNLPPHISLLKKPTYPDGIRRWNVTRTNVVPNPRFNGDSEGELAQLDIHRRETQDELERAFAEAERERSPDPAARIENMTIPVQPRKHVQNPQQAAPGGTKLAAGGLDLPSGSAGDRDRDRTKAQVQAALELAKKHSSANPATKRSADSRPNYVTTSTGSLGPTSRPTTSHGSGGTASASATPRNQKQQQTDFVVLGKKPGVSMSARER
ncbi:dual specificity protein phosphatase [Fimicolochytrium jonesii]|uniref:dual specificity protein phosphatase n=1 Tax=Fimicolochytrium jonesii TaxID=1396493 RepID=UPI0022FED942|nr:dual specificity protein phosphatase [Fimicolochytrium jonesii]KAI8825685.1 dual specificity protein phosphatase [Fimicolochytrium jonesii]